MFLLLSNFLFLIGESKSDQEINKLRTFILTKKHLVES